MADSTLMQILYATDELPVEFCSLLLIQSRISDDKVKKLATVSVLHNHKQLLLCLDNLVGHKNTMTKLRTFEMSQLTSYSWITFGWRTFFKILISLVILSTSFWSLIFSFSRILTATCDTIHNAQSISYHGKESFKNRTDWCSFHHSKWDDLPFRLSRCGFLAWPVQRYPFQEVYLHSPNLSMLSIFKVIDRVEMMT